MGVGTTVGIWTVGVGTVVRTGSVRTTDPGWLAATTPVPKGRKSKRRVSAGGFMRSARRNAAGSDGVRLVANTTNQSDMKPLARKWSALRASAINVRIVP